MLQTHCRLRNPARVDPFAPGAPRQAIGGVTGEVRAAGPGVLLAGPAAGPRAVALSLPG